jgi:hypothetical protein
MYSAYDGPEAAASSECRPENKVEKKERNVNHRCFEPMYDCCLPQSLEETFLKSPACTTLNTQASVNFPSSIFEHEANFIRR